MDAVTGGDWSFRRFMRESRSYTRPMPWWQFYPQAVRRWFWFEHQQRLDNLDRTE